MKSTTTVHWNRGGIAKEHNRREAKLVEHEDHIDNENIHGDSFCDVLVDRDLKEVYEEVFGDAIDTYNATQRKSRQKSVESYMAEVENDNRGKKQTKKVNDKRVVDENAQRQGKSTEYELTIHAGNTEREKDADGRVMYDANGHHIRAEYLPRDLQRQINTKYCNSFEEANPNFKVVSAIIHGDEGFYNQRNKWEYSTVHSHITFVPIAHGFKQGLSVQNSMNKALKEMGFEGTDVYDQWAKKEQARLEEITLELYNEYCLQHPDFAKANGELEIYHPVNMRTQNKTKEEHAREQECEEREADLDHKEAYLDRQETLLRSQASEYLADKEKWQETALETEIELNQQQYNIDSVALMQADKESELKAKEEQLDEYNEEILQGVSDLRDFEASVSRYYTDTIQKAERMGDNTRASRMAGFMGRYNIQGKSLYQIFQEEEPKIIAQEKQNEMLLRETIDRKYTQIQSRSKSMDRDYGYNI